MKYFLELLVAAIVIFLPFVVGHEISWWYFVPTVVLELVVFFYLDSQGILK